MKLEVMEKDGKMFIKLENNYSNYTLELFRLFIEDKDIIIIAKSNNGRNGEVDFTLRFIKQGCEDIILDAYGELGFKYQLEIPTNKEEFIKYAKEVKEVCKVIEKRMEINTYTVEI